MEPAVRVFHSGREKGFCLRMPAVRKPFRICQRTFICSGKIRFQRKPERSRFMITERGDIFPISVFHLFPEARHGAEIRRHPVIIPFTVINNLTVAYPEIINAGNSAWFGKRQTQSLIPASYLKISGEKLIIFIKRSSKPPVMPELINTKADLRFRVFRNQAYFKVYGKTLLVRIIFNP